MERQLRLQVRNVRFYSQFDETTFFEWLARIPAVIAYDFWGRTLRVKVSVQSVNGSALRELVALFHRYRLDMNHLTTFDEVKLAEWCSNRHFAKSAQSVPRATCPLLSAPQFQSHSS